MTVTEVEDDRTLGIRHRHDWQAVTTRPRLQSAHDSMRWDVSKSRILSVNTCVRCDEFHRESVQECTTEDCHVHPICERPHR
jgi:hypothetical protein